MTRQVDVKALISHLVRGDGTEKCRICMGETTEGQVYLGDTVMVDGEKPVTLAELLEQITGVEILVNKSLASDILAQRSTLCDAAHSDSEEDAPAPAPAPAPPRTVRWPEHGLAITVRA